MALSLNVANQNRWDNHLSKNKNAFNETKALQIDMVTELRKNEYITQDQAIQLEDRLYGSTLLDVLRNMSPTEEQVEDLAAIFEKYGCRLLGLVMTRFNKNGAYFAAMTKEQLKISKLVNNVDEAVNGLVENELLEIAEKSKITKFSNKAIQKKTLVEILALKDIDDELPNILAILEDIEEREFVKAIYKCFKPPAESQNQTSEPRNDMSTPQAESVSVMPQTQPAQVGHNSGNGDQRLLWVSLLRSNREDLLRKLEIRNTAQLQALANRGCIDQKELIEINNQPEVVMQQRVHVFLDILARRQPPNWQMLTNIIEAFSDPLNPAAANIFRNIRDDMFSQG